MRLTSERDVHLVHKVPVEPLTNFFHETVSRVRTPVSCVLRARWVGEQSVPGWKLSWGF